MKLWICSTCKRQFASEEGCRDHIRAKHPRKSGHPLKLQPSGKRESMASLFIQGELNRAMGIPNEDWLEDMLP